MQFSYPFNVLKDRDEYIVTFPDVPEAITGANTRMDAIALARDALIAALGGYIEDKMDIPIPSEKKPKQFVTYLRPLEAAKVALYMSMSSDKVSNVKLAKLIDVDEKEVRRMLDLDHQTKIEKINSALRNVFGYRLVTHREKIPMPVARKKTTVARKAA